MNQTMSITRALVTLKNLTDRINRAIASGTFVSVSIGKNQNQKVLGSSNSIDAETKTIKASYQKVDDLIAYRQRIKSQIILSNALTKVVVLGREMSVAEAIELKSTVELRRNYLAQMRKQLLEKKSKVETQNAVLEATIQTSLDTIYGSEKSKIDAALLDQVATPQRQQKELALLDPSDVQSKIDALQQEIDDLTSEVDFVLSESNAKTEITVLGVSE